MQAKNHEKIKSLDRLPGHHIY